MITERDISTVIGSTAIDADGDKIGNVAEVYLDDQSGNPEWATVKTGMFGTKSTFIPLAEAQLDGESLRFPYDKDKVKDAPKIEAEGHLSPAEETELYRYYGLADGQTNAAPVAAPASGKHEDLQTTESTVGPDGPRGDRAGDAGIVGQDTSGPTTDDAMTRSEERLNVGTQQVETGKARLRKHIVTENVTRTVPVTREEATITREPITEANMGDAMAGGALTEEEHEVTLHADRVVTSKETVPVERVRLDTDTVTEQETVNAEVSHEEIEQVTDATPRTTDDQR